ncbi:hypothetical protein HAX54_052003, partial [Datura stramonium]|nr:hypothetical protein [Datura stramonium]
DAPLLSIVSLLHGGQSGSMLLSNAPHWGYLESASSGLFIIRLLPEPHEAAVLHSQKAGSLVVWLVAITDSLRPCGFVAHLCDWCLPETPPLDH